MSYCIVVTQSDVISGTRKYVYVYNMRESHMRPFHKWICTNLSAIATSVKIIKNEIRCRDDTSYFIFNDFYTCFTH